MPSVIRGSDNFDSLSSKGLGDGQSWQIVTGSRAYATTYTNTTGRPILAKVHIAQSVANAITAVDGFVSGIAIHKLQIVGSAAGGSNFMVDLLVPPGATYSVVIVNNAGGSVLANWVELR